MNNKPRRPGWLTIVGPAGIGALMMLVLTALIFFALTPASAISTVALPEDIKPVTVNIEASALKTVPPTPTPANTPIPTPTPQPTSTVQADPTAGPTETPVPTATPLPPLPGLVPARVRIPSVGINAFVEQVGLDSKNRMDVPRNIWNVAWFKLGAKPGERGNAVIDGHVDGPYSAAVFWDLRKVQPGTKIYVQDASGQEKTFEVYDVQVYPYDQAPLDRIFGPSNDAQLNLITCTGTFDRKTENYDKRFVAYSRLVQNP
ncbi:MAG TPA: class F sortase [Chloroflexia bacterium]|nr:class F sortase [Chloroflexia bacterium]